MRAGTSEVTASFGTGMAGMQLAEQIQASWPSLPILIATGYAELPKNTTPKLPRLSEPYEQEEIAAAISRLVLEKARLPNKAVIK
jgi:hypothetical protein